MSNTPFHAQTLAVLNYMTEIEGTSRIFDPSEGPMILLRLVFLFLMQTDSQSRILKISGIEWTTNEYH